MVLQQIVQVTIRKGCMHSHDLGEVVHGQGFRIHVHGFSGFSGFGHHNQWESSRFLASLEAVGARQGKLLEGEIQFRISFSWRVLDGVDGELEVVTIFVIPVFIDCKVQFI